MKKDTSHYAECSTKMKVYQKRHLNRLLVMLIIIMANFYFFVPTFAIKYMGNSFASAMMANAEISEEYAKGVGMGAGVGSLAFMAVAAVGGIAIFLLSKNNKLKIGYTVGVFVVFSLITFSQQRKVAAMPGAEEKVGVSHLAFGMGVLTLLLSLGILVLGLLGNHQHPRLFATMVVLIVLAGVTRCYFWPFAVVIGALNILAIPEYVKMQEMMKLPGYPYFNERFDEQQEHSEYENIHKLDGKSFAVMEDMDGNPVDNSAAEAAFARRREERHPAAVYTMTETGAPDEMPGIGEILEAPDIPDDLIPAPDPKPDPIPDAADDMPGV